MKAKSYKSEKFKERLRLAMAQQNIRARELAKLAGIGEANVSRYLKGTVVPRVDILEKLANVLHVDKMWLWGYDVPMTGAPSQADQLREEVETMMEGLDEEQMKKIRNFIRDYIL